MSTSESYVARKEKWFLLGRKLWALLLIALPMFGVDPDAMPLIEKLGTTGVDAIATILLLWSILMPDHARLTALPNFKGGRGATLVGLVLLVSLSLPGCAFVGHKGATIEQKFYEVDAMCTDTIDLATDAVQHLRAMEVEIPEDLITGLRGAVRSLKVIRYEVRGWVEACGKEPQCDTEERILRGIKSMEAIAALVVDLVAEAKTHE